MDLACKVTERAARHWLRFSSAFSPFPFTTSTILSLPLSPLCSYFFPFTLLNSLCLSLSFSFCLLARFQPFSFHVFINLFPIEWRSRERVLFFPHARLLSVYPRESYSPAWIEISESGRKRLLLCACISPFYSPSCGPFTEAQTREFQPS